jgi:hypothetical protein
MEGGRNEASRHDDRVDRPDYFIGASPGGKYYEEIELDIER